MCVDCVRAKVARADEHIEVFHNEARRWVEGDTYGFVQETNADGTYQCVRILFTEPPDLIRWGLVIGDAIHNLRSALDHIVHAIAVVQTGEDPPPGAATLQFPICSDADRWTASQYRIESLPQSAKALIERLQPYYGRDGSDLSPLWLLRELDNIDKHHVVRPALFIPEDVGMHAGPFTQANQPRTSMSFGPLEHKAPVVEFRFLKPAPRVNVQLGGTMTIAMENAPAGDDGNPRSALGLLDAMKAATRDAVDKLMPFMQDRHTT